MKQRKRMLEAVCLLKIYFPTKKKFCLTLILIIYFLPFLISVLGTIKEMPPVCNGVTLWWWWWL